MTAIDAALIEAAAAAHATAKEAKQERARAMDALTELLLERAESRVLVRMAIPYLYAAASRSDALADKTPVPPDIARQLEELLNL